MNEKRPHPYGNLEASAYPMPWQARVIGLCLLIGLWTALILSAFL